MAESTETLEAMATTRPAQGLLAAIREAIRGSRRSYTTAINLSVFWFWEIPIAYVLAIALGLGPPGVFISITIAFSTLAVVSGALFKRGRWKTRVV
jgi:Na+-driven multidrug efflux pump